MNLIFPEFRGNNPEASQNPEPVFAPGLIIRTEAIFDGIHGKRNIKI